MESKKGTKMKQVNVTLTASHIELLRGVLYEYYKENEYLGPLEETIHSEVEEILADAEDQLYSTQAVWRVFRDFGWPFEYMALI